MSKKKNSNPELKLLNIYLFRTFISQILQKKKKKKKIKEKKKKTSLEKLDRASTL